MNVRRKLLLTGIPFILLFPAVTSAAAPTLTLRHKHFIFTINPDVHPEWQGEVEEWRYNDSPIQPLAEWRVDGDDIPPVPDGITVEKVQSWNVDAIATTVREEIGAALNRDPQDVRIYRDTGGLIAFDGVGMMGRHVDEIQTARLITAALEQGAEDIDLPVTDIQPVVTVDDPELAAAGIKEIVTVGESNFAHSTFNRRHNISTGLSKFNGTRIPQGAVFSFNDVLGPVNASTGYVPELVILGDRTVPEYGGGLCQISSTAYRGVWEYGFPIEERRNHSYAVRYYAPQGTDATIYPGSQDMKFRNDGPSDLVIQTHTEGDNAYYIYYGTRDDRRSQVIGPFTWDHVGPPADRTEYTTDLPPGVTRKLGERVPGLKAAWYRIVQPAGASGSTIEEYYSVYQARPLYYQIGVESVPQTAEPAIEEPSWLATPLVNTDTEEPAEPAPVDNSRPSLREIRSGN